LVSFLLASCGVLAIMEQHWVGHGCGTAIGAREAVGGTGQNTKRKLASAGHTHAGESGTGLVTKKGSVKGR